MLDLCQNQLTLSSPNKNKTVWNFILFWCLLISFHFVWMYRTSCYFMTTDWHCWKSLPSQTTPLRNNTPKRTTNLWRKSNCECGEIIKHRRQVSIVPMGAGHFDRKLVWIVEGKVCFNRQYFCKEVFLKRNQMACKPSNEYPILWFLNNENSESWWRAADLPIEEHW